MREDVLLRFLGKRLINVGGDDAKLERLRQTAVDLSRVLRETPAKATPFALVAFDPHVPTTDPTIVQVEDALRNRWETYVNTFSEHASDRVASDAAGRVGQSLWARRYGGGCIRRFGAQRAPVHGG